MAIVQHLPPIMFGLIVHSIFVLHITVIALLSSSIGEIESIYWALHVMQYNTYLF